MDDTRTATAAAVADLAAVEDADEATTSESSTTRRTWPRRLARELAIIATFVLLLFSARWSLADHYRIPTGSMVPTVHIDDRVVVNKASYDLRLPFTDLTLVELDDPRRGDVVVLDSPEDDTLLLKRIVAVPGDTVEVHNGRLRINDTDVPVERDGDALVERLGDRSHPLQITADGGPDFGPLTLPERRYLVMGDNRGNSRDGRIFGLVERDRIRGEALGVYYRGGLGWHEL